MPAPDFGALITRCRTVGWTVTPSPRGTLIYPPGMTDPVVVPGTGGTTTYRSALDALNAAGLTAAETRIHHPGPAPRFATVPLFSNAATPPDLSATTQVGMRTETVTITPELAAMWLAHPSAVYADGRTVTQRRLNPEWVNEIIRWITSGEWMESYEGIALSPDGAVLDGQHRLHAIAASGVSVPARVTFNAPPELFKVTNRGLRRTGAHVLQTMGVANTLAAASTLKVIYCFDLYTANPDGPYRDWRTWPRIRPSNYQIAGLYEQHPDIDPVITAGGAMVTPLRGVRSAAAAFLYLAARAWPAGKDHLTAFTDAVQHGEMLSRGDPAKTVRDWITRDTTHGMRDRRERHLHALMQCWNAYAVDRTHHTVTIRAGRPGEPLISPIPMPYTPQE